MTKVMATVFGFGGKSIILWWLWSAISSVVISSGTAIPLGCHLFAATGFLLQFIGKNVHEPLDVVHVFRLGSFIIVFNQNLRKIFIFKSKKNFFSSSKKKNFQKLPFRDFFLPSDKLVKKNYHQTSLKKLKLPSDKLD